MTSVAPPETPPSGSPSAEADGAAPRHSASSPRSPSREYERSLLRVSRFDVVTSLFMALILFLGAFVLMLFIVWLLSGEPEPLVLKPIIEQPAGRADNAEGFERDFEPPGAEEVEELMEPTLQDSIQAVTDAVSSVAASLDSMNTNATASTSGRGKGDSRPPGPEGEGENIVPRFERWQLKFSAKDVGAYARQLDYYGIELGAIGGSIQGVDYASNLAGTARTRRGESDSEKRLYFMWTSPSPLMQYDQQLLAQAGVPLAGRQMLKFIPKELETRLAHAELEYAKQNGHPTVGEIAKTVFESQSADGGYEFVVISQRYRSPQ